MLVLFGCGSPENAGSGGRHDRQAEWSIGFTTVDGEPVDIVMDGRPVMLVFWTAWAPACTLLLERLPQLTEDFQVLTVLADVRDPAVDSRLAGDLEVLVPLDATMIARYDVELLPTVILLAPDGEIGRRFEGYHPGIIEELRLSANEDLDETD